MTDVAAPSAMAAQLRAEQDAIGTAAFVARTYKRGPVVHIVLFRFAPHVSATQREDAKSRFLALRHAAHRDGAPYIDEIVAGAQCSGEGADAGFELAVVVRFASEGDRNYYVGAPIVTDPAFFDPVHHAFKEAVGPLLAPGPTGVLVVDFRAAGAPPPAGIDHAIAGTVRPSSP